MSLLFDLAETINIGWGALAGEATTSIRDRVSDQLVRAKVARSLAEVIRATDELSTEARGQLVDFVSEPRVLDLLLGDGPGQDTELDRQWEHALGGTSESARASLVERLRIAVFDGLTAGLTLRDQALHWRMNFIRRRLDELGGAANDGAASQATIKEVQAEQTRWLTEIAVHVQQLRDQAGDSGRAILSVSDRVNEYLPGILDRLTRNGCAGREAELDLLHEFVRNSPDDHQWWRWVGTPWAGKTALAAHLATHAGCDYLAAAVFIIGREPAHADSDAFYSHLIPQLAQIARMTTVEIPADLQGRIAQLNRVMRAAAGECLRKGTRLLIIVDGIDEDQSFQGGARKQSMAASIPMKPPPNVRIVTLSRENPPLPSDVPQDHPLRYVPEIALAQSEAARAAEEDADRELQEILDLVDAQGSPYGQDALALIAAAGAPLTADALSQLTGQSKRTVERMLSTGTGRSFNVTKAGDGVSSYSIGHDILDEKLVRDYLPRPVTLDHLSEVDYSVRKFHTLAPWRRRIAVWGSEYSSRRWPLESPTYLLSATYITQLMRDPFLCEQAVHSVTDTFRIDRLVQLHLGGHIAIAQLDEAANHLAKDVASAPAATLYRLGLTLNARLRVAGRYAGLPPEVPALLARVGQGQRGLGLALSVPEHDLRAGSLTRLSEALVVMGDRDGAILAAHQAAAAADQIGSPELKAATMADVAGAYRSAGAYDHAQAVAGRIDDFELRTESLMSVAESFVVIGRPEEGLLAGQEAQVAAANIIDPEARAAAQADCSEMFISIGDAARALAAAATISEPAMRARTLVKVAEALISAGDVDGALGIVSESLSLAIRIAERRERSETLARVAEAYGAAGELDGALIVAARIAQPLQRASTLERAGRALVAAGRSDRACVVSEEAVAAASRISQPDLQAEALSRVAEVLVAAGRVDVACVVSEKAVAAANRISQPDLQAEALSRVAEMLVAAGRDDLARAITKESLAAAKQINDDGLRADALVRIGEMSSKAANLEVASTVARDALTVAIWTRLDVVTLGRVARLLISTGNRESVLISARKALMGIAEISELDARVTKLVALAYAFVETELNDLAVTAIGEALTSAAQIAGPDMQAIGLAELAEALVEVGDLDRALSAALRVAAPPVRAVALARVAEALAAAGEFDRALSAALRVAAPPVRAVALARVAEALAAAGELDRALSAALRITARRARAAALVRVAESCAAVGDVDRALSAALGIASLPARAIALAGIADLLAAGDQRDLALVAAREALTAASVLVPGEARATAFARATRALALSGDKSNALLAAQGALSAATQITRTKLRAPALAHIADLLFEAGLSDMALKAAQAACTAATVLRGHLKAAALTRVAKVFSVAGDRDLALAAAWEALGAVDRITDDRVQATGLARATEDFVASDILYPDMIQSALTIATQIAQPEAKAAALAGMADVLIGAGHGDLALDAASRITIPQVRAATLSRVSEAFTLVGDRGRALSAAQEALDAATEIVEPDLGAVALARVAESYVAVGDNGRAHGLAEDALSLVRFIAQPEVRATTCARIADSLVAAGRPMAAAVALAEAWLVAGQPWVGWRVLLKVAPEAASRLSEEVAEIVLD